MAARRFAIDCAANLPRARAEAIRNPPQPLREVVLDGRERSALLVGWLDELVYLAETEDLVPEEAGRIELGKDGLRASVRCRRGNPRHMVKAATYHRLAFGPSEAGFCARVVLDV